MFHRLTVPTYVGGLPGGYDYINDPSDPSVGGSGVPSFADGKKAGGPNDGTYFVAFGEDATSSFANRGMKALAQNTDAIDDLLHRDIALTARTADVLAASPVSSVVLAGAIFVGEFGVPNNQNERDLLVSVLDNNDNEIIDAAGVKVVALLIHNGSSVNVVGTTASGFFSSPTVNFNTPIPAGVTYRVIYGERGNLATLPKDAFTNIKIRGAQEVSGEVERVLRDLHSTALGVNYNDPWLATINSIVRTGLDGRYRQTTVDPGTSPAVNTPGAGANITRDGQAVTFLLPTYSLDTFGTVGVTRYPDPALAVFRMRRTAPVVAATPNNALGGDIGLMQESPHHTTGDANEVAFSHVTGALLLDVVPRSITANTLGGNAVITRIGSAVVATVNPTAGSDATSRRTIQVGGSDFVQDGSGRQSLRKSDLIEVTDNATGLVVGTFRVDGALSSTRFTVKTLTGALPALGPSGSSAAVKLRWLQTTISIGGQTRDNNSSDFWAMPDFFVAQPSPLTSNYDANAIGVNAVFLSALYERAPSFSSTNQDLYTAMGWGGFDHVGFWTINGRLLGDGGIVTGGGRQTLNLINRKTGPILTFGLGASTKSYDLLLGSLLKLSSSVAINSSTTVTFALVTSTGYVPTLGDKFELSVRLQTGSTGPFSMVWPADFVFSGDDGDLPNANTSGSDVIVVYEFTYMQPGSTPGWYAKRLDY